MTVQFITEIIQDRSSKQLYINIQSSLPSEQLPISCQCHRKVRSAEDTHNTKALQFVNYPRSSAAITASMTKLAIIPIAPWPDCAWKCTEWLKCTSPKIIFFFFHSNKSFHLFKTHCAFLPLFNPNIDLLQAVKVTKSSHHLSHDRASKGYGPIPCLMPQTDLHRIKSW